MSRERLIKKFAPDWQGKCESCGHGPIVPQSGLCGPCHFGTTDAVNGGWWDDAEQEFDEQFAEEHLVEAKW